MKVFVSSTFIDLQDHRKAVDEIINRLNAQYRGMEYFGARPYEPKEVCFDEISKCQVFVGIYAHRYGWIPEKDKLSITEQEFDFARRKDLDCYCYVVDPNYPWPLLYIEHQEVEKLHKFLQKVNRLVRSVFTTPDNLAKQIAADLQSAADKPLSSFEPKELLKTLQAFCAHEIKTTIGPKYIKDLYVGRTLNQTLKREMDRLNRTKQSIRMIKGDCNDAYDLLCSLPSQSLTKEQQKGLQRLTESLPNACKAMEDFEELHFSSEEFYYPAHHLYSNLSTIKNLVLDVQRHEPQRLLTDSDSSHQWETSAQRILSEIGRLEHSLRPISLIIDRAGGGKTNLLCRLAEDIGKAWPVFFMAAKSISHPTDQAILQYISSVYPIGDDPIQMALRAITHQSNPVVLIVDGINENYDPVSFNAGFKAFVRRYYGSPILYVVSCRDIYWNYFQDEWWLSHCGLISRDELYSFTNNEFRKALPKYLQAYDINAEPIGNAREQLHHPLLLRFYCEAFKGLPNEPTKIGKVDDIRLLELFDTYCHRKFNQIKERLGLISGDEVFTYLQLIARMMLRSSKRLLTVPRVAKMVKKEFNEESIRSIRSLYVQILDEDILLEQKPAGTQLNLLVSFVYDEFMEYVIARALWSDLAYDSDIPTHNIVEKIADTLLKQKDRFISVLGVVVYLGELLAISSHKQGVKYIDWLVSIGQETLACRLIIRWPKQELDDSAFLKLLEIHKYSRDEEVKREAWKSMEKVCLHYWNVFYNYITNMELRGSYKAMTVFSILGRVGGGPTPQDQIATIQWIVKLMKNKYYMLRYKEGGDYKSGASALKRIIEIAKPDLEKNQIQEAEDLMHQVGIR